MGQTHCRGGLVDLLTARAGGAEHVHLDILIAQLDLVIIVAYLGHDLDSGKGGVAASGSVKRGDADKPVYAVLTLEEAVGIFALDHYRCALDAGLVPVEIVHDPDLIAVAVSPHVVHTVEHRGPVLRLGAAGTGVEGEDGVVRVILAGEQSAESGFLDLLGKLLVLALKLLEHRVVVLLNGHLAYGVHIVPRGAELLEVLDFVLERLEPLLDFLGFLHIVPEALALRGRFKLLDFLLRALKLQRAAQILKTGLCVIELYLIFFKFKHCFNHFQMIYFIDYYYTQKQGACKLLFLYAI